MKLKIFFAVLLLVSVFCVTTTAFAMTDQERQVLIAQIQAQIAQLTQQLNQMLAEQQGNTSWCHNFNTDLDTGSTGSEVVALQTALQKEGFYISTSELQNQQFGSTTGQAVKDFKVKYSSQIVTSGTTKVADRTRGMLNQLYGCTSGIVCAQDVQQCLDGSYVSRVAPSCAFAPCRATACIPYWYCGSWNTCINGQQTKTCTDSNNCGTTTGKPATTQSCISTNSCVEDNWTYTLSPSICPSTGIQTKNWNNIGTCSGGVSHPSTETVSCNYQTPACTSFTYSNWDLCSQSGVQTRTVATSSPSGCINGNPVTARSCTYTSTECTTAKNCQDLYQNCYYTCSNQRCVSIDTLIALTPYPECLSIAVACTPSWSCGSWGACANGQQTKTCTDSKNCGVTTNKPATTQSCTVATCSDTDNNLGGVGQSSDGIIKGWNYWYKGTATGILISGSTPSQPSTILGQGSFTDTCKDSKNLKEYICLGDNVFSYDTYCPLGCADGACSQGLSIFLPKSNDVWGEGFSGGIYWSFNGKSLPTTPVNIYLIKGNIKMLIAQSALPDDEASGSSGTFAEYRYSWAPWRSNIVSAYKQNGGGYLYDSTGKIGINFPGRVWRILVEYNGQSQYSDFFEIKALEYGTDSDSGASDAYKIRGAASGWAGSVSSDGKELIGSYMADPAGAGGSYSIKLYYGPVTLTDFCWNSSVLIEYSVAGPYITSDYIPCPQGQRCSLGRCN